jgi:hypothetical protein
VRIAQTSFGLSGGFCPISLPRFQGRRLVVGADCSVVMALVCPVMVGLLVSWAAIVAGRLPGKLAALDGEH